MYPEGLAERSEASMYISFGRGAPTPSLNDGSPLVQRLFFTKKKILYIAKILYRIKTYLDIICT